MLWTFTNIELVTSAYAVEETKRNLARACPAQLPELERLLQGMFLILDPYQKLELPPEIVLPSKDIPILAAAIHASATHLITGDKDHFGSYYGTAVMGGIILPPSEYLFMREANDSR
jgi:predicted nucleic acid-binding protein